ncbi:MAG: hypothetical protein RL757_1251 [Bacteroidota bacterium]|jgi:hypothetical protein
MGCNENFEIKFFKCNFIVLLKKLPINFNAKIVSFFILCTLPNEKKKTIREKYPFFCINSISKKT